jgi:nicotinamide phosphoribosyltransferase
MKATYCKVNGEDREIFKDPITDDGTKRSLKGLLRVRLVNGSHGGRLVVDDQCNAVQEKTGILQTIFKNGTFYNKTTLLEIRKKLIE